MPEANRLWHQTVENPPHNARHWEEAGGRRGNLLQFREKRHLFTMKYLKMGIATPVCATFRNDVFFSTRLSYRLTVLPGHELLQRYKNQRASHGFSVESANRFYFLPKSFPRKPFFFVSHGADSFPTGVCVFFSCSGGTLNVLETVFADTS